MVKQKLTIDLTQGYFKSMERFDKIDGANFHPAIKSVTDYKGDVVMDWRVNTETGKLCTIQFFKEGKGYQIFEQQRTDSVAREAQISLNALRATVIGIYKHNLDAAFELVIKTDGLTMDTIRITPFGAIQQNFGLKVTGQLKLFPEGKNLGSMVDTPFEWAKFIQQF